MARIVHFCFLISALVIVAMGWLLHDGLSQDQVLSVQQHEINRVLEAAHRVRDSYVRAEILAGEYAAHGNPDDLAEKEEILKQINADFVVLETQFHDDADQLQRLNELTDAYAKVLPMLVAASSALHENHALAMQWRRDFFEVHSALRNSALDSLGVAIQTSQSDIHTNLIKLAGLVGVGLLLLIGLYVYALRQVQVYRRLEQQQKESDELLRLTADSVGGMIVYIDRDRRYKFCNKAYAQYVGTEPEAIVGATLEQVLDKHMYDAVKPYVDRALSGQIVQVEYAISVRGRELELRNYLVPHRDHNGHVLGFFGEIADITDFKHKEALLLETTSFQKAILDSARISIITTDLEGIIQSFNVGAELKLGYQADELVGKHTPARLHDEQECGERAHQLSIELDQPVKPGFELFTAKARLGYDDEQEWTYVRKDGSRFPVFLSVTALRTEQDDVIGYLGIAVEITQQKRTEAQLIQARTEAEAAARAKSAFLATMSHEIRTPMNGVLGMAEVLALSALTPHQKEIVRTIRESSNVLLTLIDDILDFSKIEAGRLELNYIPLSVRAVAEGICTSLQPVASNKSVDLNCVVSPDVPELLWADDVRLRQVLYNLLGNAIKFSDARPTQRGHVRLRVDVVQPSPLKVSFSVTDNGIGIAPEALEGLFSAFTQAENSTTRRFGGTGLGLAICKRIVELWEGDIQVESTLGIGSTFTVTLPFTQAPASAKCELLDLAGLHAMATSLQQISGESLDQMHSPMHAKPATAALQRNVADVRAQGRLILVAEDDEINQKVIMHQLDELGYTAAIANTGAEALRMWRTGQYALLLTDVHMPELDGCSLAVAIRAEESGTSRMPILALTANALRGESGEVLSCGMDDYLTKPVRLDVLKKTLEKWMPQDGVAMSPPNPHSDVVDIKILSDLVGGDDATVYELLTDFQVMSQDEATALHQARDAGDGALIVAIAHKLKSSSRSIGALALGDVCADLEKAGKAEDAEAVRLYVRKFDDTLAAVNAALNGLLAKGTADE